MVLSKGFEVEHCNPKIKHSCIFAELLSRAVTGHKYVHAVPLANFFFFFFICLSFRFRFNDLVSRPRWLSWMHIGLVIRRLWVRPPLGLQHSFMETDHIFYGHSLHLVILSIPLIQEGQSSVSGERMCTILVNRLED